MRLPLLSAKALVFLGLPLLSQAIFHDEVGVVDFHHELLGLPDSTTTFFHKPRKHEKASLLYSLTDLGVLGAVNPSNGAIVWRQFLGGNTTNGGRFLRAGDGQSWLGSAQGSSAHTWDALTGRNLWWRDFDGEVKDLEILELTGEGRKDVLALVHEGDATVVRRLREDTGDVIWEFRDSGRDIPLQVSTDIESVFAVSLHGSPESYAVKVSVLDPQTGKRTDEIVLGTKGEVHRPEDVMFVGSNSAAPIIAWVDPTLTKLHINVIGTKSKLEFPLAPDTVSVDVHAPQLAQSNPHFLVHTRTKTGTKTGNRAEVYHINLKTKGVAKAYDLPHLAGTGAISISTAGANVYFTRITEDEIILVDSTSHGVLGRWSFKAGVDTQALGATTEVLQKGDVYAFRSAITTSDDDWVLVKNGEVDWTRPEGLSGAVAAAWAEIPDSESLAKVLDEEAHTNPLEAYVRRLSRHLDDLQYLPDYLLSLPPQLLKSVIGTEASDSHPQDLATDSFGFRKLIILATKRGKLYALDSGDKGRVLWSRRAFNIPAGEAWEVTDILVDDSKGEVTVVGGHGESIIVRTDTGDIVGIEQPQGAISVARTAVIDTPAGPQLLSVGSDGSLPDLPLEGIPAQTVVVRGAQGDLRGVRIGDGTTGKPTVSWTFTPPAGQVIVSVAARPSHDPVASIGRVLGDRKVRYKYLNPNTVLVASFGEEENTLTTYLLDSISGQVLSSVRYEGVDGTKSIDCTMSENWFACTFFGQYVLRDGSSRSLQGYQIAVSDLYESEVSNDRGPLGDAEKFSALDPVDIPTAPVLPSVVSQSWILSGPVERLTVTQTRQGITRRQLLGYLPESHSVIGFPREFLDPRRPVGRDPTKEEMEAEALMKYSPHIESDPRFIVSHLRDVIGVEGIIATPAIVESTSLVLAYGVDVFATRVTPSAQFDVLGKDFNKITLLGTVAALAFGVVALKPLVSRRQINLRWQAPM
ncbi:uncharacterized protein DNG_02695 [Cephalotrichum gorgonifer]|uniref:ER membrane protein complex subunit 1 n=1 Tax=Cephalotrichum gorgonifer TaxID=2041049 RepID=A0AAE8MUF7_9PEZI|nr:uncharacterized protein DNG_02695 [Cephalotrichum gorgonifer]